MDKTLILKGLMEHKGMTSKRDFAKFLGISAQTLSNWFARNSYDDNLLQLKFTDVNPVWIKEGTGEMLRNEPQQPIINYDNKGVPFYDVDFIGGFDVTLNDQTTNPEYHIDFKQYNHADFWINVTGHSMEPELTHGDMIAIKALDDWETHLLYGEMYALVTKENRTVKYVRKSSKGDQWLLLKPVNTENYDEQDIPKAVVQKVYKVLGAAKRIQ